ncbi:polysaccharide ABC transporter ATP-binding protein [Microbaculum marinum]|uniref:Polysaccharide ABC transporter ATP-binding protein n=1 Tax=Microbaculum marinum TaxID=1764581 RepID=A0AAW9RZJ8_9HYPH
MLGRKARRAARHVIDMSRGRQLVSGDQIEEFWALRDVAFDVRRGEVVGVIGRNGAGKSTLLKILSRITEPTTGRAVIRGRVASLLEVGTGFHPELTGRENIFLNGAILGLSRAEIRGRFDEIVDFAEIERFLDTPVKRYSSGMYVRLAFAVAAHLNPEILIIDEVLAVGDVAFQKKCLGKMQDVADEGRTVLFVSHNLPSVVALTSRAILLVEGRLNAEGLSRDIVGQFLKMTHQPATAGGDPAAYRRPHRNEGHADIAGVRVCGAPFGAGTAAFGEDIVIEVDLDLKRRVEEGIVNINVFNEQLEAITTLASGDSGFAFTGGPGRRTVRCNAGPLPLIPGEYRLTVGAAQKGGGLAWDVLETMPGFRIDGHENAAWMNWPRRPGLVLFDQCRWSES